MMFTITTNPLLLIFAQTSLLALTIGFTRPNSIIRYALFPASILLSWQCLSTLRAGWTDNFAIASCLGCITAREVLQCLVVALIQPWNFSSKGPLNYKLDKKDMPRGPALKDTLLSRLKFGYESAYSNRHCSTPFEVNHVPPFDQNQPSWTPGRFSWIFNTALHILAAYLLLDFMSLANDSERTAAMTSAEKIPFLTRLSEVTIEELIVRLIAVTATWTLGIPVIYLLMRIPAVVVMGLGMQRAEQFKPLFQFGEGFPWSVRRFWSHFWHQMLKDKLYLPSKFLTDNVLHLPRGSTLRRYLLILLSFTLSGLVHLAGEFASGLDMGRDSGALQFFVAQAGGILIEDSAVWLWAVVFGGSEQKRWHVWIGRLWFVTFMVWSTPIWGFPSARYGDGNVVPWSLVEFLNGGGGATAFGVVSMQ